MEQEPTDEQLRAFYRIVRRSVLLSSYIPFVEMGEDKRLYLYVGRYGDSTTSIMFGIRPDGKFDSENDSDE